MKPIGELTAGELAALVAGHLSSRGIEVVLTGGTCVTLHSEGRYVSHDLDFVLDGLTPRARLRQVLAEIGFAEAGRVFEHAETSFFLDFPEPPLAVGREPPGAICTLSFSNGEVRTLSPTDCVKDRLAAYYYFGDRQALEQAVLVAASNALDLEELATWSRREGEEERFEQIAHRLAPGRGRSEAGPG